MSLKEKAGKIKENIPAVFIALKDNRTPVIAKILAAITVIYVLSPIDFIPDFIPVLGYLDDLILIPLLVSLIIKMVPRDIWEECIIKSRGMWQDGKPKRWYYGIPIVVVWIFIIWIIIKKIIF